MEIAESFLKEVLSNYTLLALILIIIFYYIKAKKSSHFDKQQTDKMRRGLSLVIIYIVISSGTMSDLLYYLFSESDVIFISQMLIYRLLYTGLLIMAVLTFLSGIYNIKKQIKKDI